jgi:hypothetical protein
MKTKRPNLERFFFSNVTSIVLASLLLLFNLIAFLGEWLIAGTDWRWAIVLRGVTIILDMTVVLFLFNKARIYSNAKIKKMALRGKALTIILWIFDTILVLIFIFSFYVVKIFALLKLDKIDERTFKINFWLGFGVAFLLGAALEYLIAYIKKRSKKWVRKEWRYRTIKKNGFNKN